MFIVLDSETYTSFSDVKLIPVAYITIEMYRFVYSFFPVYSFNRSTIGIEVEFYTL